MRGRTATGKGLAAATLAMSCLVVSAAGAAWSETADNQRFVLVASSDDAPGQVFASGVIIGTGRSSTAEDEDDTNSVNTLTFEDGTLTLVAYFDDGTSRFDARTCVARFTSQGRFVVASGTGRFAGARGGGQFIERGTVAMTHTAGGCSDDVAVLAIVVSATGTVDLAR